MKWKKFCNQCLAPIPYKWADAGVLRVELEYANGGKQVMFTCATCRQKNRAAHEAKVGNVSLGEGI